VPPGSRRARGQREWIRAAKDEIAAAGFRNQRHLHYKGVAELLMRSMDWRARTSRPGHDRIARALDVSADTVARAVAWLRGRGLLGLVSPGTTHLTRAYVLHDGDRNDAAVYVLAIPAKTAPAPRADAGQSDIADLSRSRSDLGTAPRGREATGDGQQRSGAPSGRRPVLPRGGRAVPAAGDGARDPAAAALARVPQNRSEALGSAEVMRGAERLLGAISARMLRHLARPFFAAGWTGADVLHAVDHDPGGRRYGYTAAVRAPAAWIRARLAAWTDAKGAPVPSRAQRLEAGRRRLRAAQAAQREDERAGRARTGDYRAGGQLARQLLAGRGRPETPAAAAAGPDSRNANHYTGTTQGAT
jgi:hypothetical protein